MQQDKISIDLKLPTKWEDLTDKQLRYVFALLAQGFTATEVKAYCLHRWAGLKVLHRYGKLWACKHDGTGRETPRKSSAERELAHTSAEAQPGSRLRHPRGNSGDIGRTNRGSSESRGELARAMPSRDRGRRSQRRQRRKWFSRKYYASVMRIKEFFEDNIGATFTGILSDFAQK